MKKILAFVLLFVFLIILSSCTRGDNVKTIKVASTYPGLTELVAGDFDAEYARELAYADNKYSSYGCIVSVSNGKLCITNPSEPIKNPYRNISYPVGPGTIITYTLYGAGWVAYVDDSKGLDDVQLIANEQCVSILEPERGIYYVVTSSSTDVNSPEGGRSILRLTCDKENDKMIVERLATLETYPSWAILSEDKKSIYIVNMKCNTLEKGELKGGIVKYDIESGAIEQYDLPEYFGTLGVFAPVELDGKLYFGSQCGVFEFDLQTQESVWYPVYYEKFIK